MTAATSPTTTGQTAKESVEALAPNFVIFIIIAAAYRAAAEAELARLVGITSSISIGLSPDPDENGVGNSTTPSHYAANLTRPASVYTGFKDWLTANQPPDPEEPLIGAAYRMSLVRSPAIPKLLAATTESAQPSLNQNWSRDNCMADMGLAVAPYPLAEEGLADGEPAVGTAS